MGDVPGAEGGRRTPRRGEPVPTPPVPRGEPTPPAKTPETKAPCCCDKLYVYLDKITVKKKTNALGFITATSDEVAMTAATSTAGGVQGKKWPTNERSKSLGENESTTPDPLAVRLAEITPTAPCKIDAGVSVALWKTNFFKDIKPVFEELLGKAATTFSGTVSGATLEQAMRDAFTGFLKFAGLGATFMGAVTLELHGDLLCETKDLTKLLKGGTKGTMDGADAFTVTQTLKADGGEWEVTVRVERECPAH